MFSKIPDFYQERKVVYVSIDKVRRSVPPSKTFIPKLKEDILKNGMLNPLTLDDNSRMVCITGNQRLAVLKSLNIESVPVIFLFPLPSKPIRMQLVSNIDIKNAVHISGHERLLKKRKKKK